MDDTSPPPSTPKRRRSSSFARKALGKLTMDLSPQSPFSPASQPLTSTDAPAQSISLYGNGKVAAAPDYEAMCREWSDDAPPLEGVIASAQTVLAFHSTISPYYIQLSIWLDWATTKKRSTAVAYSIGRCTERTVGYLSEDATSP